MAHIASARSLRSALYSTVLYRTVLVIGWRIASFRKRRATGQTSSFTGPTLLVVAGPTHVGD